jgi:hydroxymethylbilane synthase
MTTEGDEIQDKPLPDLLGKGIFTRTLDNALLRDEVDIVAHSLKDIPTQLIDGISQGAVLKREDPYDVLVCSEGSKLLIKNVDESNSKPVIATSSTRRKAQWLNRYPNHELINIRGNIETRIQKVKKENMDAAIFAAAGLNRLGLQREIEKRLEWIIPSAGQGAIAVVYKSGNEDIKSILNQINHVDTDVCTQVERSFLSELNGGCSAPVGAIVSVQDDMLDFRGIVLDNNGTEKIDIHIVRARSEYLSIGAEAAQIAISKGAVNLLSRES